MEQKPWYKDGVRFKCTGCGKCCTGAPGYVWVNEEEIEKIAAYLNITKQEFSMRFLRKVNGGYSLVEYKKNHDCVFLKENKCSIYPVRPTQCKTYPYWPFHMHSKENWEAAAKECEGISDEAPIVTFEEIEEQRLIQLKRKKI